METLVLLIHLETENRSIFRMLFPEEDLLKLYLNSVTIISRQKRYDGGQIFSQEGAGGDGAIVATTLPKKSYERFYSQMHPALDEEIRVTRGRENETP